MPTRPNLNFSLIGSTNRVQPYWRLAIAIMPRMPMSNWSHRRLRRATAGRTAGVGALAMGVLLGQTAKADHMIVACWQLAQAHSIASSGRQVDALHVSWL